MEIEAYSFSLRGESGVVRIVSDSVFFPGDSAREYSDEADCDIVIESGGFRVSKVISLSMRHVASFLCSLKDVVDKRVGKAVFRSDSGGLKLEFISDDGDHRVECDMNDRAEGKENSIRVKYPIEPSYYADLETAVGGLSKCGEKGR